jgi:hypothetical protein
MINERKNQNTIASWGLKSNERDQCQVREQIPKVKGANERKSFWDKKNEGKIGLRNLVFINWE